MIFRTLTILAILLLLGAEGSPVSRQGMSAARASGSDSMPPLDPAAAIQIRAAERARIEVVQRVMPSVVCIFPPGSRQGGGSGVIIDSEGYGLTNYHVIRPFFFDRRGEGGLVDGRLYPLEVLGLDPTGDVAMFKLEQDQPFYPAPLGDSDLLAVGDWTLAMGNPFLLAEDDFQPTVTLGIVSGLHRFQRGIQRALEYTDCIQVDTSINPGNSGGPLFNLHGEVVGINGRVSVEERGRVNVGVGYAITINQIRRFIPALRAGLVVQHATLGATARDRSLGNVVIDQILTDSSAYNAGLRKGDRIVRFDDAEVLSANHLLTLLGTYPAGWPVSIEYERDDRRATVRYRLDLRPLPERLSPPRAVLRRHGLKNPLRPNPAANARATKRALDRFHRFIARGAALDKIDGIQWFGNRTDGTANGRSSSVDTVDSRSIADTAFASLDSPQDRERWIRWSLMTMPADLRRAGYRVTGADFVRGRIAVVIEHRLEGSPAYRVALDDEDGRLLRIEYEDAQSGSIVRTEYDDYRRAGVLRLPHRRCVYVGDEMVTEDVFTEVKPFTRPAVGGDS
jgi:S1-C subfamily serine protease